MNRTVVGLFDNLAGAIESVLKLSPHLGSSQLSIVTKRNHQGAAFNTQEEFADELTYGNNHPLKDLDGLWIQTANLELPQLGNVAAAGPVGGALIQGDKNLSQVLTFYGVNLEQANYYQDKVGSNCTLVLIETDSSKSNEIANRLVNFGAFGVEMWSKSLDHPLHPFG